MKFTLLVLFLAVIQVQAAENTDWPTYANDSGSSKYAELSQVN